MELDGNLECLGHAQPSTRQPDLTHMAVGAGCTGPAGITQGPCPIPVWSHFQGMEKNWIQLLDREQKRK